MTNVIPRSSGTNDFMANDSLLWYLLPMCSFFNTAYECLLSCNASITSDRVEREEEVDEGKIASTGAAMVSSGESSAAMQHSSGY